MSGHKDINKAIDYAKQMRDDVNVMYDDVSREYYVVRLPSVKHWDGLRKTVAEIRITIDVKLL